jgi:hypothetical protein
MTKDAKLEVAMQVLQQLEPLHADDPEIDAALKEANRCAVKAARKALQEWAKES